MNVMTYYEFTPGKTVRQGARFLMQAAAFMATALVPPLFLPSVPAAVAWLIAGAGIIGVAVSVWEWATITANAAKAYADYLDSQPLFAIERLARSVACDEATHRCLTCNVMDRRLLASAP